MPPTLRRNSFTTSLLLMSHSLLSNHDADVDDDNNPHHNMKNNAESLPGPWPLACPGDAAPPLPPSGVPTTRQEKRQKYTHVQPKRSNARASPDTIRRNDHERMMAGHSLLYWPYTQAPSQEVRNVILHSRRASQLDFPSSYHEFFSRRNKALALQTQRATAAK